MNHINIFGIRKEKINNVCIHWKQKCPRNTIFQRISTYLYHFQSRRSHKTDRILSNGPNLHSHDFRISNDNIISRVYGHRML